MTRNVAATAQKDGDCWQITIPECDIVVQAEHLEVAKDSAKEITALWLGEDEVSFTIEGKPQGELSNT